MPTILRIAGCRFHFHSHEPNEAPHVHVDKAGSSIKVWLDTLEVARNRGFRSKERTAILAHVEQHREAMLEAWHESTRIADERIADVRFEADRLIVDLADGRTIAVPIAWYPRIEAATPAERAHWEVAGAGYGLYWPDIDEDLSTEGLLRGAPAPGRAA